MSRIARTEKLAAAYDRAGAEIDRVVLALECGDKAGALEGMQRVAAVMNTIGALLVDGPLLRPIRFH